VRANLFYKNTGTSHRKAKPMLGQTLVSLAPTAVWVAGRWQTLRPDLLFQSWENQGPWKLHGSSQGHTAVETASLALRAHTPCSFHHTNTSSWLNLGQAISSGPQSPSGKSNRTGQLKVSVLSFGHSWNQLPKIIPFHSKARDKSILPSYKHFRFATLSTTFKVNRKVIT
jgi:hypothetical protein